MAQSNNWLVFGGQRNTINWTMIIKKQLYSYDYELKSSVQFPLTLELN